MLKKTLNITILCSTVAFVGCESTHNNSKSSAITAVNSTALQDQTWIATQIGSTAITTDSSNPNLPSLQFDSASKRVSGSDGCNRIMGAFEVSGDKLTLSQMAATRMACINNSNIDQQFSEALSKVTNYQTFGSTLKLLDRHGNLLIQFKRAIQPR